MEASMSGGSGGSADRKTAEVREAVDGLVKAYQAADPEIGQRCVHLPVCEIIEWKGLANIWHADLDEFRQAVELRKEEPIQQETVDEAVEWLSDITALVRRTIRTTLPDGRSFHSPALFVVTPDRSGAFKVAITWWGAFPDWFQG